jgi:hypothetical protein
VSQPERRSEQHDQAKATEMVAAVGDAKADSEEWSRGLVKWLVGAVFFVSLSGCVALGAVLYAYVNQNDQVAQLTNLVGVQTHQIESLSVTNQQRSEAAQTEAAASNDVFLLLLNQAITKQPIPASEASAACQRLAKAVAARGEMVQGETPPPAVTCARPTP